MTDRRPLARPRFRWALALAIVAALAAAAAWIPPTSPTTPDAPSAAGESDTMLAIAPGGVVDLASLSAEDQALYQAAAADPDGFQAVACYCGCEAFLDHRHLLDCFVRPSGGWERHAAGCAICLAQARDVIGMREEGIALDEIVRTIDDRYGGITDTPTA